MNEILAAFFAHPTVQGAVVLVAVAIAYGVLRLTVSGTKVAASAEGMRSEMVGMRQDRIADREADRIEHDKTRQEVRDLREDVLRERANGAAAPLEPILERRRSRHD